MAASVFRPLEDDLQATRLIRVVGRDKNGYINCSARSTIIGQDGYIALSHVWGSHSATFAIMLDERPFWVRPNLYSFLLYGLEKFRDQDFWIDALCINQDDIKEKNQQIPLMGQVFSRASKVIGWLHGSFITAPNYSAGGQADPNVLGPMLLATLIEDDPLMPLERCDNSRGIMSATLMRLMEHEYWSRLWIVQELALARRVVFLWEGQAICWDKLRRLIITVMNKSNLTDGMVGELATHLGKARERVDALSIMSFFSGNGRHEICGNERRSPESSPGTTLLELALQYQDHHCSMLHDCIYALRALAVDGVQLKPDYSKTPLDLLVDVHTDGKNAPRPYPKTTKRLCQLLEIDFSDTIELDIITQPQQPPNHLFA
ncbi:hypothetical protein LTR70_010619, partial [Exophiala xenobiotica]